VWKQVRKRNESFDLCVYSVAVYLRLGADRIANWDRPPKWAAALAENAELVTVEDRRAMQDTCDPLPSHGFSRCSRSPLA